MTQDVCQLTFIEAVLPPVLGPVMITALTSGLTQMSMGTGGGSACEASFPCRAPKFLSKDPEQHIASK